MSTIDSDLTDEERERLHAASAAAPPDDKSNEPAPSWEVIKAMIDALPDVDILPTEKLAPVIHEISRTEPLVRDQLAALLKTKIRGVKAKTIDEMVTAHIAASAAADPSDDNGGEEAEEARNEAIAKMTLRCATSGRPAIFCTDNEAATVDQAIEALVKRAPWIFARDGRLVTVRKAKIIELNVENVRYALNRVATFIDASGPKLKVITGVPYPVDAMVHARGLYSGMRELVGVATTPILHADGSVFATRADYDPATKQVYIPKHHYPAIPETAPTLEEAQAAAGEILDMFVDFPMREPCDRAAILALILTQTGRHLVKGPVPGVIVQANAPRVGKGKIVETSTAIAYGRWPSVLGTPKDEKEFAKQVGSYLKKGQPHIAIDNATGEVGGAVLDALLTARRWDSRTLGFSEMGDYDLDNLLVTVTANNARLIGDTAQRMLPIRLHTDDPHPELREGWQHTLPEDALRDHVRLHLATLTVLRYGLTLTGPVRSWGSFEAWCQVIRRTVIAVLGIDPCSTRDDDEEMSDGTVETLRELLAAIHGLGAGIEWTASKLLEKARGVRGVADKNGNWIVAPIEPDEALNEALSSLLGDARRAPVNVASALLPHKGRKIELGNGQLGALERRKLHGVVRWRVDLTLISGDEGKPAQEAAPETPSQAAPADDIVV